MRGASVNVVALLGGEAAPLFWTHGDKDNRIQGARRKLAVTSDQPMAHTARDRGAHEM
jgi:hypothetical protein